MRAYARHRGISATAVHRAVEQGRIVKSVVRDGAGKFLGISDAALADQEWAASTDLSKASTELLLRTAAEGAGGPPGAAGDGAAVDDGETMTLSIALAKEKHWKALTAELDYKKRVGELVDATEVESRIIDEYSRLRTKLLGLARKAKASLPHLTREDVTVIDTLVREALEDLASATDEPAA
jgi:phage terminase Nu1 subunit (DNA packaging protein)